LAELLTRIDLWIVLIYLGAMLLVAGLVSARSRDVEGYTVGGREIAGWTVGLSVLGTYLSSITFLGLPAKTYATNWNAFLFGWGLPFAAAVAVFWFVPLYRRGDRISAYELLEQRFGYWARLYADLSYLLLQLIRVGTVLLLVAFAVEPFLRPVAALNQQSAAAVQQTTIVTILVGLGLMVIVYDTLGGIRAVIWTDVLQVVVLLIGASWCLAILIGLTSGSAAQFLRALPAEKLSLGPWQPEAAVDSAPLWLPAVLIMLTSALTENLRNYAIDQNYVQRMLSARSDRAAKNAIWLGALSYLPISVIFCLLGTGLAVYYGTSPTALPDGTAADQVFPHFIRTELSPVVAGLVLAGILAAAMSTVDSSINSASTVLFVDVVRRLRVPLGRIPDIVVLRSITILLGVLGTGMAAGLFLLYGQEKSRTLMDLWWQYAGVAGGGMFGLFLLAWLTPRIPSAAALAAVLLTLPLLAWGMLARDFDGDSAWAVLECPIPKLLVGVSGTGLMLLVGGVCEMAVGLGWLQPNPRCDECENAPQVSKPPGPP